MQQKPVVNQLNVLGNTAGTTRVVLKELGNVAVGDLNGARVVQVAGDSAGEFVAQSRLVAGGMTTRFYAELKVKMTTGSWIPTTGIWSIPGTRRRYRSDR